MVRSRMVVRVDDGVQVKGYLRQVLVVENGIHTLSELAVYADGVIHCGTLGRTDLAGLRDLIDAGRIVSTAPPGISVRAPELTAAPPAGQTRVGAAESLAIEVADELDALNDRPDSAARCLAAVRIYLREPSEENRRVVRERYLAVPGSRRITILGDMDQLDIPLRVLVTDLGHRLLAWSDTPILRTRRPVEPIITMEDRQQALDDHRLRK